MMGMSALWLSTQEPVVVEEILEPGDFKKYNSPRFHARRQDGTTIMIDRRDIILEEEQALIDELAHILFNSKNPVQHERYAIIMRQFIIKGVPYVNRLQKRKPHQESLDLFSVS